ncbi:MAG: RrF2 family transcriptional regulator [Candidatus Methylomirabilales bacterium]
MVWERIKDLMGLVCPNLLIRRGSGMRLTRGAEYGTRAVLYLARQPQGKLSRLREIAADQGVPLRFLAKVIQALAKAGLVRSSRGAHGGVVLARDPRDVSIKEVIEAIEGPVALNICLQGEGACSRQAGCSIYPVWQEAQRRMLEVLEAVRFADLAGVV